MGNKPVIGGQEQLTPYYARYHQALCARDPALAAAVAAGAMRRVSFRELAAGYEVILFDAYGVLNRGETAIPGAPETVAWLAGREARWLVVSNNASQTPGKVAGKLKKIGFAFEERDLLTSGMAVAPFIAASAFAGRPYYLVGTPDSMAAYAPDPEHLLCNHLEDGLWERAEYLLVCSNRDYYGTLQQSRVEALLAMKGLPIVLANPDMAAPNDDGGVHAVSGFTAAELVDRFGVAVYGVGKPFPFIFEMARQRFPGVAPQRFLMVGDTLDTDILGAAAAGFSTCLTLSGVYANETRPIEDLSRIRGIRPDFIVESIAA